ncbi:DNA photolyase, partial [bacterium]|nr:DNA photolyase [bacterium]
DYSGEIGETVVSWSLNAPKVTVQEEGHAAPIVERLKAAALCRERGFRIGLHFDPLLFFPGWEDEYRQTVATIFKYLKGSDIIWISIGAFRFMPQVKEVLRDNHANSNITAGEFIRGLDGKQRYFSAIRLQLYRFLVAEIKSYAPDVFIYFCMEDKYLWQDTFGFAPADNLELGRWLDQCCYRFRGNS